MRMPAPASSFGCSRVTPPVTAQCLPEAVSVVEVASCAKADGAKAMAEAAARLRMETVRMR
ncbi:hypothetical protein D3C71_2161280 [compost metagenome]